MQSYNHQYINLTAAEIGVLWTSFLSNSMAEKVLRFMLLKVEDPDIKKVAEKAYLSSKTRLNYIENLFSQEEIPMPIAFSDEHVNEDAPDLFTDSFKLAYILNVGKVGMLTYSAACSFSSRADIRDFFSECLQEDNTLYQESTNTLLNKGLYLRRPYMQIPDKAEFIESTRYLSGLNPFLQERSLNSIEIGHLSMNIETNQIGVYMSLAFMQTAKSADVREYMRKGHEIAKKHIKVFTETLLKDDIQSPVSPDHSVTNSTVAPFSDKLMMFHYTVLTSAGIGNYASAAAASQRTDLALNYERLSAEIGKFAKDGATIMIKHKWLEQPPGTKNRYELAKQSNQQ